MNEESLERLRKQVRDGQSVTPEMVEQVLHHCRDDTATPKRVFGFYLTKCDADGFREDDLAEFMYEQLVPYICSKDEYREITADRVLHISDIVRDVIRDTPESGEPGEVLLYILLESRGIIQLYSKMDLKTSGMMAFHGYDALHIEVGDNIVLHFGHAKNHASFAGGLVDALEDVERFKENQSQKRREIRLVSKNLDKVKFGKQSETIRKLILPYGADKEYYSESNSVLLASEWSFTKEAKDSDSTTMDNFMMGRYESEIGAILQTVNSSVDSRPKLRELNLLFLILPLTNVKKFRSKFVKRAAGR